MLPSLNPFPGYQDDHWTVLSQKLLIGEPAWPYRHHPDIHKAKHLIAAVIDHKQHTQIDCFQAMINLKKKKKGKHIEARRQPCQSYELWHWHG